MNCSINSRIKSSIPFNHIAIMVRSLDRASAMLSKYDCEIGAQQTWDSEGTAEIYVGSEGAASRLLLIEPIKSGPYARALEKRGPGIHHLALTVINIESFVDELSGSGWYLHPSSLKLLKTSQTIYLTRPGVRMLIEVQQGFESFLAPPFITRLECPLSERERHMIEGLGLYQVIPSCDEGEWIVGQDFRINVHILANC